MVPRAQFPVSSHNFYLGHAIKYFIIRLITKQSFTNIWLFCLMCTGIEANKVFVTLFLVFDKIKQNKM